MWSISKEIIPFFIGFILYVIFFIKPFRNKVLGLYFVLGFFYSIFDTTNYKLLIKIIIWGIPIGLMLTTVLFSKRITLKHAERFLLFGVIFFLSTLINNCQLQLSAFYFMDYLTPFCLLLIGANFSHFKGNSYKIFTLIFSLFLFQVVASVIKFIKYGSIEPIVGSIQSLSGSASVILILIMVSYCISFYLVTKKNKYLYYLIVPIFIGITSVKRVIWFYIPVLILLLVILYNYLGKSLIRGIRLFLISAILGVFIIYLGLRLTPTLNPERKMWGSFDLNYALNYVEKYNMNESKEGIPTQRFSGAISTLEEMKGWKIKHILLGKGPTYTYEYIKGKKWNIWGFWGRETAFSMYLISYGILGVITLYIYLFSYFKYACKAYRARTTFEKCIALMVISFFIIYILDFIYSRSAIENHILSPVMMFFTGYCIQISSKMNNYKLS